MSNKAKEIYERWNSLGLLFGLTEEKAFSLAEKYEELAKYILDNKDKIDEKTQVIAFPTLRRAFQRGLNEKYSPRALCEKIKNEYEQEVRKIKEKSMGNVDAEAEYCTNLADYFSRDNKRK